MGAYQWVERRLFEVLGAWGSSQVVPEVQVLFDVYSQQHAWHAELFAERLPVLDSLDPAALVVPPNAEVDRMLSELSGGARPTAGSAVTGRLMGEAPAGSGGSGGSGGTLLRPRAGPGGAAPSRDGYVLHLRRAAPVAEAPLARSLRLVLRERGRAVAGHRSPGPDPPASSARHTIVLGLLIERIGFHRSSCSATMSSVLHRS